jgi:hypothetical protein
MTDLAVDKAVLNLYLQKIEYLALNQVNENFFNSGSNHALIVLNTIVRYAKNHIKVFAGNLCTDISNDKEYIDNLRTFFMNGGKMQVLLCDFNNDNNLSNKNISAVFKDFSKNVTLKKTKNVVIMPSEKNPIHFTVADSKMYRFETDTVNKIARGNFNDTRNSKILETVFDKLFTSPSAQEIIL